MNLPCLRCGVEDSVRLCLDKDHDFICSECDETYSLLDAKNAVEAYTVVLAWIEKSPFMVPEPEPAKVA